MPRHPDFSGAKIAVLCDGQLLTLLRDDKPTINWPNLWDLPGGGREGHETPVECALRETFEEFGLQLDAGAVHYQRVYPGQGQGGLDTWFLVAEVPGGAFEQVVFGDEGQRWAVMSVEQFLALENAIPHLQVRLRKYFQS